MVKVQKKSLKVGKLVNSEHVDNVVRNYKQERWVHNSRRLGKEDSLSIWYSIEELEEFLEKAKEHGGDGVRLYFGAYDQDLPENPLYAGRQTIVLVATKEKEMACGGSNSKDIYIQTEQGSSILAYNAGRPCPPFCTTVETGDSDIGITIIDRGDEGMAVI